MKNTIATIVLSLLAISGIAAAATASSKQTNVSVTVTSPAPVTERENIPSAEPVPVTTLNEVVIVGHKPMVTKPVTAKKSRDKVWACTVPHTMEQGPVGKTVRDCAWQ